MLDGSVRQQSLLHQLLVIVNRLRIHYYYLNKEEGRTTAWLQGEEAVPHIEEEQQRMMPGCSRGEHTNVVLLLLLLLKVTMMDFSSMLSSVRDMHKSSKVTMPQQLTRISSVLLLLLMRKEYKKKKVLKRYMARAKVSLISYYPHDDDDDQVDVCCVICRGGYTREQQAVAQERSRQKQQPLVIIKQQQSLIIHELCNCTTSHKTGRLQDSGLHDDDACAEYGEYVDDSSLLSDGAAQHTGNMEEETEEFENDQKLKTSVFVVVLMDEIKLFLLNLVRAAVALISVLSSLISSTI